MKNSRSVNLGVVIASVMLVASYVNAAEPDATKGKALSNVEAVKPAEALAKNKSTDTSPENSLPSMIFTIPLLKAKTYQC